MQPDACLDMDAVIGAEQHQAAAAVDTTHRAFFGDAVYAFKLTYLLTVELERKTGVGIGALCGRVFRSEFGINEIAETIRLALIGGGTTPENAAALVAAYVHDRPLSGSYSLAVDILRCSWFGAERASQTEGGANG